MLFTFRPDFVMRKLVGKLSEDKYICCFAKFCKLTFLSIKSIDNSKVSISLHCNMLTASVRALAQSPGRFLARVARSMVSANQR